MSSYRRYYLPSVSWSDVKGGVWRIQPYNVTDYFFIFRVQNLLTSASPNRKLLRSKQVGGKVEKSGKSPNRKQQRSKQVGGKVVKSGKSPNRKQQRSKCVGGKVVKSGKSPKLKKGLTADRLYANITVLCEKPVSGWNEKEQEKWKRKQGSCCWRVPSRNS